MRGNAERSLLLPLIALIAERRRALGYVGLAVERSLASCGASGVARIHRAWTELRATLLLLTLWLADPSRGIAAALVCAGNCAAATVLARLGIVEPLATQGLEVRAIRACRVVGAGDHHAGAVLHSSLSVSTPALLPELRVGIAGSATAPVQVAGDRCGVAGIIVGPLNRRQPKRRSGGSTAIGVARCQLIVAGALAFAAGAAEPWAAGFTLTDAVSQVATCLTAARLLSQLGKRLGARLL